MVQSSTMLLQLLPSIKAIMMGVRSTEMIIMNSIIGIVVVVVVAIMDQIVVIVAWTMMLLSA